MEKEKLTKRDWLIIKNAMKSWCKHDNPPWSDRINSNLYGKILNILEKCYGIKRSV